MTSNAILFSTEVVVRVGLTPPTWAVNLGAMKQNVETVQQQTGNVKKEAGDTVQNAKEMKAKNTMKNAGEMKGKG